MKIAISGKSGCGNSTVSRIVSEELGIRLINYTFHSIAEETGKSFREICRLAEQDNQYDLQVDRRQIELASEADCVLGSRLAIWLLKEADLRVYLQASLEKRACRVHEREGGSYQAVLRETRERDRRDQARYLSLYDIDMERYEFADLIIDAETRDQYQIAQLIIEAGRPEHLQR